MNHFCGDEIPGSAYHKYTHKKQDKTLRVKLNIKPVSNHQSVQTGFAAHQPSYLLEIRTIPHAPGVKKSVPETDLTIPWLG